MNGHSNEKGFVQLLYLQQWYSILPIVFLIYSVCFVFVIDTPIISKTVVSIENVCLGFKRTFKQILMFFSIIPKVFSANSISSWKDVKYFFEKDLNCYYLLPKIWTSQYRRIWLQISLLLLVSTSNPVLKIIGEPFAEQHFPHFLPPN